MYLRREEVQELFDNMLSSIEQEIGEKHEFLYDLIKQDDWTFVIKAHALIEAAMTQMLVDHLGEPRLTKLIERLPIADSQTGKIAAAKFLGLTNDRQRRFIRWFSELRNKLVHRLENLDFSFEAHLSEMDRNEKRSWLESVVWYTEDEASRSESERLAEEKPKFALLIAVHIMVTTFVVHSKQSLRLRQVEEMSKKTMKELFAEDSE